MYPKSSSPKKANKLAPETRPRRRASQTYFIKYQLARNPLKAEEEDLKLALLASLQQCNETNNGKNETNKDINDEGSTNNNITASYSHYAPIQKKEPQDEDYLRKYKPETEDFLTFICFRTTAPNGIGAETIQTTPKSIITNGNTKHTHNNIKKRASRSSPSPDKLIHNNTNNNHHETNTNGHEPTDQQQNHSPNNRLRPIRQSPRLATRQSKRFIGSNRKCENDHNATAYDNSIDYEEELKRVSIALEDMAQEINSSDGINGDGALSLADNNSKTSPSSPLFKNNKHLQVKGLMTREFAGAFADEETIFESISNHKL